MSSSGDVLVLDNVNPGVDKKDAKRHEDEKLTQNGGATTDNRAAKVKVDGKDKNRIAKVTVNWDYVTSHSVPGKARVGRSSPVQMTKGDLLVHEVLGHAPDQDYTPNNTNDRENRAIDVENRFRAKDPDNRGPQRARVQGPGR